MKTFFAKNFPIFIFLGLFIFKGGGEGSVQYSEKKSFIFILKKMMTFSYAILLI